MHGMTQNHCFVIIDADHASVPIKGIDIVVSSKRCALK